MSEKFYVTTPIYYVNDVPHIGHAYTTIAADILARRNRLLGREVFFLTGTDEHGQKVDRAAADKGRTPKEHADLLVGNFKDLWRRLNISHDAFIRTTDPEHIKTVQGLLQLLWDRGEIVKRSYSGWYCTPDERFWTEKDLVEGKCPDCGRPVDQIDEENYFFLMSKYQDRLVSYIEEHPDYILPETRRNEVLGFLKHNDLGDLCISRPKQRLSWGIAIPFDDRFVTYVWFDALVNYFSATRYLAPGAERAGQGDFWWPASHHLVGKDILTTHAVYWSTMLMALNLPLPESIFAHGWWTIDGKKMSKSVGNVVDPHKIAETYGVDAFRYFLFREVSFGLDGDFSEEALVRRINVDLANDLGNLLNRFRAMTAKYFDGAVDVGVAGLPDAPEVAAHADLCERRSAAIHADEETLWHRLEFNAILDRIWDMVRQSNLLIAQTEPWKLMHQDPLRVKRIIFNLWNALRLAALHLFPFMPETGQTIWSQLGLRSLEDETRITSGIFAWTWKPEYAISIPKTGPHLFERIEMKATLPASAGEAVLASDGAAEKTAAKTDRKKEKVHVEEQKDDGQIGIEDFAKVQLKVGKVISAERVEKSNKLIKLIVDSGQQRQIVAGIGKSYAPEDLVGKKIVVVANLKPAKLMGVESHGMLLAATDEDGTCSFLMPERDVKEGSKVK